MHQTEVGKLEEEARKRKEKLERLRGLKNKGNEDESHQDGHNDGHKEVSLPKPKFRSYDPQDETLKESLLPKAEPESVLDQVKDQIDAVEHDDMLIDEVDLTSLAPRKVDWDLKRSLAKKLDKLERRTQRAIAELIRDRLKESGDDLLEATQAMDSAKNAEVDNEDDD